MASSAGRSASATAFRKESSKSASVAVRVSEASAVVRLVSASSALSPPSQAANTTAIAANRMPEEPHDRSSRVLMASPSP